MPNSSFYNNNSGTIVVYWLPTQSNMPFQRRRKLHIPLVWASLAENLGQGKNPTLHSQTDAPEESDLWTAWQLFPLGDDQTCHSKDGVSVYSDGLLWEEIERSLNYYMTKCSGYTRRLEIRELEKWCCREDSTLQRAGPPGLRLSNPGERERNADGHKSWGQYVAVLFGLQLPLTHNPFYK